MNTALKFAQARLSPPTFGQIASEAALETPASYFEDVVKEYVARRNVMVDGLNTIPGVFCPKPTGAFYAMARLPIQDSDHFCQWLLEDFQFEMSKTDKFYLTSCSLLFIALLIIVSKK